MELFKDIEGYEGLYQVSNFGNVKSLKYGKERILIPSEARGYLQIYLCKNGKRKMHHVHRLVASAFIPNPDNLPQVNHKDECKVNNCVENLEWCTAEYNLNYGTHNKRSSESKKGLFINRPDQSILVDMLTKEGKFIRQFPSGKEGMRWLRDNGFPKASNGHINQCCKGKRDTAYGFKWRYATGN